jgi:2-C-methyl-D-erythritol 4-phosphate cytidylyltransferase
MSVAAIVPAAGRGERLGARTSKPLVPLNGAPLLAHALRALQRSPAIRWIIVVARPEERARVGALIAEERITKALPPCAGGDSRAESVARGFAALPQGAEWVLIHDGARPCVSPRIVAQAVAAARRHGAAVCALPASLTVKAADAQGDVRLTLDREQLWFAQTPQVFRRAWMAEALGRADGRLSQFPDDAALVESAGFPVRVVPGDPLNIKVTTPEDLLLAEAILSARNGCVHESRHRLRRASV